GEVDAGGHDIVNVERFALQLDLPPTDARGVEQIVHETDEVRKLAGHDRARSAGGFGCRLVMIENLHAGDQRRQRIPYLMTQHGEKLVLAAVRFAELLFAFAQRALHLLSLADVDTRADDSPRAYREHARQNVEPVVACLVSKGRLRFGDL